MHAQAPRAHIAIQHVTPHQLTTAGFPTNSTATGLRVVPKGTYAYFLPMNIANDTKPDSAAVQTATWSLSSKPSGSTATLTAYGTKGTMFLADLTGEYQLKLTITTLRGTDDTTISVFSSTWVGVGNFQGVAATYPNCMSCHASMPAFAAIFDKWKVSGHANIFKYEIDSGAAYYSIACIKCHTTGYDHNIVSNNGGFDDIAAQLGWKWYAPPKPGKWDSIKTQYPGLVNLATIGCEMCHGPGSNHTMGGDKTKIQITAADGACAQCHDEPWRHNKYAQYENSTHSEALYESGFSTRNLATTTLSDCMRCHDGRGYILFTKGLTQSTAIAPTIADHTVISCATCHDPHGNDRPASLRPTPSTSDTLGSGLKYTNLFSEEAKTCVNCHKARRDGKTYGITKPTSSTWGPHYTSQADVFLGENFIPYQTGVAFAQSMHKTLITKQCVGCHMVGTTDTGTVNRDKVGGHTFRLRNPDNNFQHADSACGKCHGFKGSFDNFIASQDYDGNGVKESFQKEIDGLLKLVRKNLPPKGLDSINVAQFTGADSILYRKAFWNYQMVLNDGSRGIHNPKLVVDVLTKTVLALGGTIAVKDPGQTTIKDFALSQNYPNPFNPSTKITFNVAVAGNVKLKVYDAMGALVKEVYNHTAQPGSYTVTWNGDDMHGKRVSSGVYIYKLETSQFTVSKKMIMLK
ncbi:MAG: ammonia-forming cytochrome c nitrite reductase subunit c552 [Ignavibacteria bacterium]|nr:ammonia-forming cytochrome c nitrite reductase subunit c552 [Ignavibacteria bacterium]